MKALFIWLLIGAMTAPLGFWLFKPAVLWAIK